MSSVQPWRSLLWRVHFWAALIASPFALLAALTGMLYVFTPQIEASLHGHLDRVAPAVGSSPLAASVRAAIAAAPTGWTLHSVMPGFAAGESVKVSFMPPPGLDGGTGNRLAHDGHGPAPAAAPQGKAEPFLRGNFGLPVKALVVYVNPHTAQVLGQLPQSDRFSVWARRLHSTLLQDGWRWMIELAASWVLVMLVTGICLWWPRAGQPALPELSARGRVAWKQWHAIVGVGMSLVSAVVLVTGLTWSEHAGKQVRLARDAVGQTPPRIPAHFTSIAPAHGEMLSWDGAWQAARRNAPDVAMEIMPPKGREGFWRANHLDRGEADRRFDLLLDAYTGAPLYYSGWADQTAFGKATIVGIRFHRGELGLWNQLLLLLFGLGILFSLATGWVMYFKRRRLGMAGLPPVAPGAWKSVSPWAWGGALAMLAAMPLMALSAIGVVIMELLLLGRSRGAARSG